MLTSLESFSDTIIAQFYQLDTFTNICVFVKTGLLYEEKVVQFSSPKLLKDDIA